MITTILIVLAVVFVVLAFVLKNWYYGLVSLACLILMVVLGH